MASIVLRSEFPGRVPGVRSELDPTNANLGLQGQPYTALLIGQMLGSGSATELIPELVSGEADAKDLFGVGSNLANMVRAFRETNTFTQLYCIALDDDGGATQAALTLTVTGTATAAGTLSVLIAGRRVRVGVASGATAEAVRQALVAAINLDADLPVTAAAGAGAGEVDITARHAGEIGNDVGVFVSFFDDERTPAGLAVAGEGLLTGGATNPTLSGVLPAAMGETWFNVIAFPWKDSASLGVIEGELADRFLPSRAIDGVAFFGARDTHANLLTFGGTRNSPHVAGIAVEPNAGSPSYEFAASVAGHVAQQGNRDPALPYHDHELGSLVPARINERFTVAERAQLLNAGKTVNAGGLSTLKAARDGTALIERLITTYKSTGAGTPDEAFLDVTTLLTLSRIRFDWNARASKKFGRKKIAKAGTLVASGDNVVTVETIRSEAIALARDWEAAGLVEDLDTLKREIRVERDPADPTVALVYFPPDLVNPLRQINTAIAFRL